MDHKEKIKSLPASAGVYIMKDIDGAVLYVGKANNLKKRVSSYFYPHKKHESRIAAMVGRVADIIYVPASSEAEALIYENSLIKQLSPKYNIALRDDKSYPMLKLTLGEKYPRLFITRQKRDDGSLYYGPYSDAKLLRKAVIMLRQIFPLRTCGRMPKSLCLNYHIRQCQGPCQGMTSDSEYKEIVSQFRLFLEGKKTELIRLLTEKMLEASRREDFEEAGRIKGRIEVLGSIGNKAVSYGPSGEIEELKTVLGMKSRPESIEAFDVSNIMGKEAVGSMVSFFKGRPRKSQYRKFRIKTVDGVDDYSMMREVVRRRYSRLLAERGKAPDLILVDGGKGHLAVASDELEKLGLGEIEIIGIAKEYEHIYSRRSREGLVLPKESKALHLLVSIRDEAHRFAIQYHKRLRSKNIKISELDDIGGVGKRRKKALLERFGHVNKLKEATIEDLIKIKGMNEKTARNIIEHFKK